MSHRTSTTAHAAPTASTTRGKTFRAFAGASGGVRPSGRVRRIASFRSL
ncbi:MAG: hypothetical protein AVDCRST_MAG12-1663 [uncultured Rubrobacteraceae bacterium]|uniref:Uncharacterized protein n=1 Tax=uncultured Rubrobacteraceae bacterium TaxID=349277 RepID=A0A6J4S623_9ACTN|nr:MAG: hypothetical protein AVDCRST_MAG12-1663 [uncultured Rubrobacteraceae bacterium]